MAFRGNRSQLLIIGAVVVCMWTAYSIYGTPKADSTEEFLTRPVSRAVVDKKELHPSVKVVALLPTFKLPYQNCVPLPTSPRTGVKICIYPKKQDIYVSGELEDGRLYEPELVLQMASALKADPSLQLVDLGANIGMYTLYAAALGRHVLAVEMLPANAMMIQASLVISNIQENVTLINNALYSDHRTLGLHFIRGNVGGTHLNVAKVIDGKDINDHKEVKVNTVCLDDLLPLLKSRRLWIKMDIERVEANALECAKKFFANTEVMVVMMEWQGRDLADDGKFFNAFMEEHGFMASLRGDKMVPVGTNVDIAAGYNVFFVKP